MKRRSLTLVLCLLATLSLASVGFAAWVISAGDIENATGNILVEDVSDERLLIQNVKMTANQQTGTWNGTGWTGTAPQFVFGKPVGSDDSDSWLKADKEDLLSFELTFEVVKKANTETHVTDAVISISLTASPETAWIKVADDSAATATYDNVAKCYKCTVKLTWGSFWGDEVNPFEYYNDGEKDANDVVYESAAGQLSEEQDQTYTTETTYGDHAYKYLHQMYQALKVAQFTVSINAQPAAQNQNQG